MMELVFIIIGVDRFLCWLMICDYVINCVFEWINGGDLGIVFEDMVCYIVYDVGVVGLMCKLV